MILGVDSSMTAIGLVVLDDNGKFLHSEVFRPSKKNKMLEVYFYINNFVIKNNIDFVGIEGYAYGIHFGRIASMAEITGVIKLALIFNKVKIFEIAPTLLKKYITGKGNSKKELILKEVYKQFKVDFETDHEADAFVLANMVYNRINNTKIAKWRKKCLDGLKLLYS